MSKHRSRPFARDPQAGVSLVAALVGVSMAGMLAVVFAGIFGNAMSAKKKMDIDIEKQAIAAQVLRSVSCQETLPSGTCVAGSFYKLKKVNGAGVVSLLVNNQTPLTVLGAFTVRAECIPTGDGLRIRAARLRPTGTLNSTSDADFMQDPLTGQTVNWSDKRSLLFGAGIHLCTEPSANWADVDLASVADYDPNCMYRGKLFLGAWEISQVGSAPWLYFNGVDPKVLTWMAHDSQVSAIYSTSKTQYRVNGAVFMGVKQIQKNCFGS